MSDDSMKENEGGLGETIKVIIQALLLALVVRTLLFQPFSIPLRFHEVDTSDRRLSVRFQI